MVENDLENPLNKKRYKNDLNCEMLSGQFSTTKKADKNC